METASPAVARPPWRTPQACCNCRRRKSKCNGQRPNCAGCVRRKVACTWPADVSGTAKVSFSTPGKTRPSDLVTNDVTSPLIHQEPNNDLSEGVSIQHQNTPGLIRSAFEVFFRYYHADPFCSFLHRPSFESASTQSRFLVTSVIALSSMLFSDEEVQREYGLNSATELSKLYLEKSKKSARELCDSVSVVNIQANLILSLADFFHWKGSGQWMFCGIAIRMAQAMRLGKEYNQVHTSREKETRRRTFWACFLMDRMLAFHGARPRIIQVHNVLIQLPCHDSIFAYEEEYTGPQLNELDLSKDSLSHLGISPFFIQTIALWSDMFEILTSGGRMLAKTQPRDPAGNFARHTKAVTEWQKSLPTRLQWSASNYRFHQNMGQGKLFVTMHFLLHGALCVAHQEYLPQLDGPTIMLDATDAAGLSLLYHDPELIAVCLSNAKAVGEIATFLYNGTLSDKEALKSTFVAAALLCVASTQLWAHYVNETATLDTESHSNPAMKPYFELSCTVLREWHSSWNVSRGWSHTLETLHSLYRFAYGYDTSSDLLSVDSSEPATFAADRESQSIAEITDGPTLGTYESRYGDGFPAPSPLSIMTMNDNIRLTISSPLETLETKQSCMRLYLSTFCSQTQLQNQEDSPASTDVLSLDLIGMDWNLVPMEFRM